MRILASENDSLVFLKNTDFVDWFSFDIIPYVRVTAYDKNEYMIQTHQPLTRLLFLQKGTAKLYGFHKNGRRSLINFFTPPCVLGGTELFDQEKNPFPLVASTSCVCLELDAASCRDQLLTDACFLQHLCNMILQQNVTQNRRYMNLVAYPGKNNLALCLLMLQVDGMFLEPYTEIADYLGMSYRHLMHLITEFCDSNVLQRTRDGLKILDWMHLELLASEIADDA